LKKETKKEFTVPKSKKMLFSCHIWGKIKEILNPTLLSMKRDGEPVNYETTINRRNYQYLDRNKFTNTMEWRKVTGVPEQV